MKKSLLFAPILISALVYAQENDAPKWQFKGYLKSLQATTFIPQDQSPLPLPLPSKKFMLNDMLLHNRLNIKWLPTDNLNFYAELRSRIFWGDQVRYTLLSGGDYVKTVSEGSDDFFDWSVGAQNDNGYAIHTTLDRFYGEFYKDNWEVRLGRQRVNWGIATTWNPNDIFNAYNFTDFDYEERPGSDALRIKRYTGVASSVEVAVKAFRHWDEATAAMLAKFNTGSYDWQVLAGVVQNNTVLGGGWAGNLGTASFKGEAAWFHPLGDSLENSYALTLGIDYTLANQMYLNGGILYNSAGSTGGNVSEIFAFQLSARNLYPYRYSVLAQVGYPFTPLLNGALVAVYSPGKTHAMFLNPVITYSLAQNWDLDVVGQLLFQKDGKYKSPVQAGFLRVKWSF
ncbi:MAG: hypothetical protein H6577_24755 [Lewinellaceae bacterium]|nr:hypothetical protein [Saprospiraceae bacterium]MCB9341347.1 hypothetical protein [Lewinellaceae bacterium]